MSSSTSNTVPVDKGKDTPLPPPEAGLEPLNYREQFSVRV